MTAPVIDLGPSWLRSLPDGVRVRRRVVLLCTVTAVADGWFSARVPGEKRRRYFDLCQVGDADRPLLVVGAKFWWLSEWTGPGEVTSAIRLRRLGVTPEQAFTRPDTGTFQVRPVRHDDEPHFPAPGRMPVARQTAVRHRTSRPVRCWAAFGVARARLPALPVRVRVVAPDHETPARTPTDQPERHPVNEILPFTNEEFSVDLIPDGDSFKVAAPGLARALGFRAAHDLVRSIPPDEQGYALVRTPSGEQRVLALTEAGFYRALGQRQTARIRNSDVRDKVARFQKWVYGEVLPALRRGDAQVPALQIGVTVSALARLAHREHVVPMAGRVLAYERWHKPDKGIAAYVQLTIELDCFGIDAAQFDVRALPTRDVTR